MQTFLPYGPNFNADAHCLDRQRLGKQRVECLQILNALGNPGYGWQNHPAVKMWRGHQQALALYGLAMCDEWISRGYKDTIRPRIEPIVGNQRVILPAWIFDDDLVRSHQSNLLRKMPEWYSQFDWDVPNNLPYVWPV